MPLLMGLIILPLWGIDAVVHFSHWGRLDGRPNPQFVTVGSMAIYYGAAMAAPALLCWTTWRAGLGLPWVSAMCAWSGLASLACAFRADALARAVSFQVMSSW